MRIPSPIGLFMLGLLFGEVLQAQDIHFSQHYLNQTSTNPALTGNFTKDQRAQMAIREQWRSVGQPFTSYHFSWEQKEPGKTQGLSVGARLLHDRAGDSRMRSTGFGLSAASSTTLDSQNKLHLLMGILTEYSQRSISYGALRFGNQFNGSIYDNRLAHGEGQKRDWIGYLGIHCGIAVRKELEPSVHWMIGASAWNLSRPRVSFKDEGSVRADHRLNLHAEYGHRLKGGEIILIPTSLIMLQGPYQEIVLGGRIMLEKEYSALSVKRFYLGLFSRFSDAAFLSMGIQKDAWEFGLSYDINTSSLEVASRNHGAIELQFSYQIDRFHEVRKQHKNCPSFL